MATVVVTEPVSNGLVLLKTSIGEISIELWPREAPKAVRNFVQLCLEGFYDGVIFHRVIPNFIAQTGDPTGTGSGGECIYDEGVFADEFNQRLKFTRRGLVAMANQGTKNSNLSQFFFTLDRTDELNNRNTIFGRVAAGDTLFNVLKLNDIELEGERPLYPPVIKSAEVLDNPFPDIVPRITAQERKEQDRAKREMKVERAKQKEQSKRKGTKNAALLSFGDEPEEAVDPALAKTKFKSAHDALEDSRLSKQVLDDRGTSATLPPELQGPGLASERSEKRSKMPPPSASAPPKAESTLLAAAREAKAKAGPSASEKIKADIAKVQDDLKKMSRRGDASDDEDSRKAKKPKRTGPSLLQLEREKYASAGKGKKRKGEDDDLMSALEGFKSRVLGAKASEGMEVEEEEKEAKEGGGGLWDDELEDDDGSWLSHSLVFRKDATLDRHSIDEYSVHDPLAKTNMSLEEMKSKADNATRKYAGERERGERGEDRRDSPPNA
ncbi:Peptidyl-prolyl cis-trans isomerase, cyclophilin-type [Pseudohyphozyma bogoriensis]|nr:Peptidyl-prolyl cis-trans isomerase, cyclophilin-type [Pseudohyphozyma bogoriensis]